MSSLGIVAELWAVSTSAKEVVARASASSDGSRRRASSVRTRVRVGTLHLHDFLTLEPGGRVTLSRGLAARGESQFSHADLRDRTARDRETFES